MAGLPPLPAFHPWGNVEGPQTDSVNIGARGPVQTPQPIAGPWQPGPSGPGSASGGSGLRSGVGGGLRSG